MDQRDGRPFSLPPETSGDGSAAIEDAVASAASLMLRHRLFPRAMAWNIQQSVERVAEPSGTQPAILYAHPEGDAGRTRGTTASNSGGLAAAQLVMAVANGADGVALEDVARSFPLLQAVDVSSSARTAGCGSFSSEGSGSVDQDGHAHHHHRREKLLRTVGKFLGDGEGVARPSGAPASAPAFQMQGALPVTINRVSVDEDQQHAAFLAMKISANSDDESVADTKDVAKAAGYQRPHRPASYSVPTPSSSPLPPRSRRGPSTARPHSPASPASVTSTTSSKRASTGKKRARGGESRRRERERVDPVTMNFPKTKTPIAPSLARALLTGYGAKRCSADECGKIAVSKGLCRGHGGGRRCQTDGCNKCAQSRSPFCWAHGGGKRCEAPGCRRSRKTKRFCVDHVEMEATVPLPPSSAPSTPSRPSPSVSPSSAPSHVATFPPLKRQMSGDFAPHAAAGGDSDGSIGGRSTITTDSDVSSAYAGSFSASNKENGRGTNTTGASSMLVDEDGSSHWSKALPLAPQQTEHTRGYYTYQDAGEQTGAFSPMISGRLSGDSVQMASVPPLAAPRGIALPSLSEALLRAIPARAHADPRFPSAPPPPSSVYASFASAAMMLSQSQDKGPPTFRSSERPW